MSFSSTASPARVVCSHGFGVDATDRGLFTDIAAAFPELSFDMFDYNLVDAQGNMTVRPLSDQSETLNQHLAKAENGITLLCHSQGCITACLANLEHVDQLIFLAPPDNLDIDRFARIFGVRDSAQFDPNGISSIPRRDGTTTYIGKDYLDSIQATDALQLYQHTARNSKVTIIRARTDEIVGDTMFPDVLAEVITIDGGHDFRDSRAVLMDTLRPLLLKQGAGQ